MFDEVVDIDIQKDEHYIDETEGKGSDRDNPYLKSIQVEDLSELITETTDCILDGDGILYKSAEIVDELYIKATHKEIPDVVVEVAGIKHLCGLGKNIHKDSWIGIENVKREVEGLSLYTKEDFTITHHRRMKMSMDKAKEGVQIAVRKKLKDLREFFGINRITFCIGAGDCHRHSLDLVRAYKGDRDDKPRPLMLKWVRDWAVEELGAYVVPEGIETDDWVEIKGYEGYLHFKRTGVFDKLVIAEDKDSWSHPKLLINYGKHSGDENPLKGKYKFPRALLIDPTNLRCGELEYKISGGADNPKREIKGWGLKWLLAQSFIIGDTADCYQSLSHLKMKPRGFDDVCYKGLLNNDNPKEVIQFIVDQYTKILPYGVQYTNHKGEELDVTTMEYMNTYFLVAYMKRRLKDPTDFYKLCKQFEVDTSKIDDNNKLTPPIKTYNGEESIYLEVEEDLQHLLKEPLRAFKSLKKGDLVKRMDEVKDAVTEALRKLEGLYEMKQFEKEPVNAKTDKKEP